MCFDVVCIVIPLIQSHDQKNIVPMQLFIVGELFYLLNDEKIIKKYKCNLTGIVEYQVRLDQLNLGHDNERKL